jgi:hypothetical protein
MTKTAGVLSDIYDAWRAQDLDWLASYLPDDFTHLMHIPTAINPMCGTLRGKTAVLERWRLVVAQYEFLRVDTSGLMIDNNRAAVEVPIQYRHCSTRPRPISGRSRKAWPVRLAEYYDVGTIETFTDSIRC